MNKLLRIVSSALMVAGLCVPSVSRAGAILIEKTDERTMNNVWCDIDFGLSGYHYYDWQDLGNWANNTEVHWGVLASRCSCDGTECRGDCLYYEDTYSTSGQRIVISKMDNPLAYQDIYVACGFEINGDCHYDWEYVGGWTGSNDIRLVLNGWNGTWDGSCWGGDFLRHE